MKTLVCLLLATSAVTLPIRSSCAQEPSFGVKISSPSAEFTVGSPIRVDATFVNQSQQMLSFFDPRCIPKGIGVRDDNQTVLELREEFRQGGGFITCVSQFLDPSKSVTLQLNLARWFDLSRPGRYFVQLAPTGVSRDGTRETQKSNVLEIRIAQRQ
jgi:hypothetical protein